MRRPAERAQSPQAVEEDLVTATGAYRIVIILLAVWTFFAGLALVTRGVDLISLGGEGTAERIVGAHLLMLVPVYALIIWHPDDYRYLRWLPYAAQLAVALPIGWDLLLNELDFPDGALLLAMSTVFFGLLIYVRTTSHPLNFFERDEDEEEEFEEEEEPLDEEEDEELAEEPPRRGPRQEPARERRYRRKR